jgi:glyoxylase-like metal-dependent hydrolase (beta-lactamase superfamily II)
MWKPAIQGWERASTGTWSFLIEHPSGRRFLYDLGCRKDWKENLPPAIDIQGYIQAGVLQELRVEKNVSEILTEGGLALDDIDGIVWSHFNFDHTGDVSTFPPSTKLIVGHGTKANVMPGFPADPKAQTAESDFEGREIQEIEFHEDSLRIGRFKAFDYFGDGSFYLPDSPGHAIGHINALVRTHASSSSGFVHLGGDSVPQRRIPTILPYNTSGVYRAVSGAQDTCNYLPWRIFLRPSERWIDQGAHSSVAGPSGW